MVAQAPQGWRKAETQGLEVGERIAVNWEDLLERGSL